MDWLADIAAIEPIRLVLYTALAIAFFLVLERLKFAQSIIRHLLNMKDNPK